MVLSSSLRTNLKFTTSFLWRVLLKCLQSLQTNSAINILFLSLNFPKYFENKDWFKTSVYQDAHLLLTLTPFPVNCRNTPQPDAKLSKIHLRILFCISLLDSLSLLCLYSTVELHLKRTQTFSCHASLCYCCCQLQQDWTSSVVCYKDWLDVHCDVWPRWMK